MPTWTSPTSRFASVRLLIAAVAALAASRASASCESSLVGTWQSDHERTMSFNRAHAKLEERQDRFLDALFGKMTLDFSADEIHLRMPDTQVPVNGDLKPFAGSEERNPYKVLYCDARVVVIESPQPFTGENGVSTYYLVGQDEMWMYTGSNSPGVPDLHLREYFKRAK